MTDRDIIVQLLEKIGQEFTIEMYHGNEDICLEGSNNVGVNFCLDKDGNLKKIELIQNSYGE